MDINANLRSGNQRKSIAKSKITKRRVKRAKQRQELIKDLQL